MERVDHSKLAANVHELARRTAEDSTAGIVYPRVSTSLEQDVQAVSRFLQYDQPFEFRCDESVGRGGRGEAPSPMRYFLSGLAFCQQVWWAKAAALERVPLTDLQIDVVTFLDMRGEHLVEDVPAHPQWVALDIGVSGPADGHQVRELADIANARCPLYSLVARAVPVVERIRLDGEIVRDTTAGRLERAHEGGR